MVRQGSVSLREIPRSGTKLYMKYYTYILKSLKNNNIYIGSTQNIEKRISLHNSGRVKSTKFYKPWKLLDYEIHNSRSEAVLRERFLKTHQQKEILKRRYVA